MSRLISWSFVLPVFRCRSAASMEYLLRRIFFSTQFICGVHSSQVLMDVSHRRPVEGLDPLAWDTTTHYPDFNDSNWVPSDKDIGPLIEGIQHLRIGLGDNVGVSSFQGRPGSPVQGEQKDKRILGIPQQTDLHRPMLVLDFERTGEHHTNFTYLAQTAFRLPILAPTIKRFDIFIEQLC